MAFLKDLASVFSADSEDEREQPTAPKTASPKPGTERITIGGPGKWETARNVIAEAFPLQLKREFENRHFLIAGTNGSGKSQLIFQFQDAVRRRGDKALIVDHGGENVMRYWRPGDIVLNPFDDRFPGWNPFNEFREEFDHDNLARFVVPDGQGDQASWNEYAQSLYASISRATEREGRTSVKELLYYLLTASPEKLIPMLDGEPAGALFAKGSEKMAANARSILGANMKSWRYLAEGDFSLRDWVTNDNDKRWIFLSYKESSYAALKPFISMAVSIAITYALDLPEDIHRRIWFFLDELASLSKMTSLSEALAKIRKKGGCVVAGLQTVSQLREKYGHEGATTLMGNFNSWICTRPGDAETAEVFSKHFGEEDALKTSYTKNQGISGGGHNQGESEANAWHVERVQTYTELMRLDDLCAVVKLPGNLPVGFTRIPYLPRPKVAEAYIPRRKPVLCRDEN